MAKDPVCGMEVKEVKASSQIEHRGHSVYFCFEPCKKKFEEDPDRYLGEVSGG